MGALAWRTFDLRKLQRVFPAACANDPHVEVKDDRTLVIIQPSCGPSCPESRASIADSWNPRVLRQLAWQLTYLADEYEREDMLVSCAEIGVER